MPTRSSRRDLICQTAISLAAGGGSHAVTHQAIDRELGIAKGSTSYYYRTRSALIAAVSEYLSAQSRAVFRELLSNHSADDPGAVIDAYLDDLTGSRRDHVRARLALALDADCAIEQRRALAESLFSRDAAIELCRSRAHPCPERAADDLLDSLEGRILRTLVFP